jgi:tetratricopeptide (TPR) repeat protein
VGRAGLRVDPPRAARLRPPLLPAGEDPALKEALLEARLLAARGEPSAALAAVDEVLQADPDQPEALLVRAEALQALQREPEAESALRRAIALDPDSAAAWNALARLLHATARDVEALEAAESAHRQLGLPRNARHVSAVALTLLWIHREARRYREAIACAEEGLARCPDAVLAQWATDVQREWDAADKDRC